MNAFLRAVELRRLEMHEEKIATVDPAGDQPCGWCQKPTSRSSGLCDPCRRRLRGRRQRGATKGPRLKKELVLQFMRSEGRPLRVPAMAGRFNASDSTMWNMMLQCERRGLVERTGPGLWKVKEVAP